MVKKLLAISILFFSITLLGYFSVNQEAIRYAGQQKAIERVARAKATTRFLESFYTSAASLTQTLFVVVLPISLVAIVGVGVAAAGVHINEKRWSNRHKAENGIFPLRDQRILLQDGSKATLTTNPNLLTAAQTLTVHSGNRAGGYQLPGHLTGEQLLTAMEIARKANNLQAMHPERAGGIQRMLSQATAPNLQIVASQPEPQRLAAGLEPMTIGQAFQQSQPNSWILGRGATGNLAQFDTKTDVHCAVLGATGTGKSAGVGLMLLAHALRLGWRVVILDGKGGEDWSPFARRVEYHQAYPDIFPDQVAHIVNEYDNRRNGRVERKPLLVILEEYGDINDSMTRAQKASANAGLMTVIRMGRDVDMHLCFIDQYPDRWEPQIIQNTRAKFVHWLEDGTIVKQYKAHELAPVGEFFFRGQRYTSFHMAPHKQKMLEIAQPVSYPLLIDSQCSVVQDNDEPEEERNENVYRQTFSDGGKWDALIEQYISEYPQALSEKLPPGTIKEITRRMAEAEGNFKPSDNYKGVASDLLAKRRMKQ